MSQILTDELNDENLPGNLLLAMPGIKNKFFKESVALICSHSDQGTMGLIVNKPDRSIKFKDLYKSLNIKENKIPPKAKTTQNNILSVMRGGPVRETHGFVLHTLDYTDEDETIKINDQIGLTSTVNAIEAIASNNKPKKHIMILGYARWAAGQLEEEILNNCWFTHPFDSEIIFNPKYQEIYPNALLKIGISEDKYISSITGEA